MNDRKTLRQQLALWARNEHQDECFGFYDWFCKDSALPNRAKRLQSNVRSFLKTMAKNGKPIDLDSHYVFFKNNCPAIGHVYDSFSICRMDDRNVEFWVTPKSGHMRANGQAECWVANIDTEITAPNFRELLNAI